MRFVSRSNSNAEGRAIHDRCGMTLIEVMVVATLTSILLGVMTSLAISLQQWDRRFRTTGLRFENQARLAEVLRSDVRNADNVSVPEKGAFILTSHDHYQKRYKLRPDGCERVVANAKNATESHEEFTIGMNGSWQVETDSSGRQPAVVVSFDESPTTGSKGIWSPNMYVYATLGADVPRKSKSESSEQLKPAQ
jgi:prepilin-type N-terminal cleavage/methylation domain-containing protein